jgi:hypothetical protein
MHQRGGETPTWSGKRYALHHAILAGNLAYGAWRDGGLRSTTSVTRPRQSS